MRIERFRVGEFEIRLRSVRRSQQWRRSSILRNGFLVFYSWKLCLDLEWLSFVCSCSGTFLHLELHASIVKLNLKKSTYSWPKQVAVDRSFRSLCMLNLIDCWIVSCLTSLSQLCAQIEAILKLMALRWKFFREACLQNRTAFDAGWERGCDSLWYMILNSSSFYKSA